jgi:hypothetical protein
MNFFHPTPDEYDFAAEAGWLDSLAADCRSQSA